MITMTATPRRQHTIRVSAEWGTAGGGNEIAASVIELT